MGVARKKAIKTNYETKRLPAFEVGVLVFSDVTVAVSIEVGFVVPCYRSRNVCH